MTRRGESFKLYCAGSIGTSHWHSPGTVRCGSRLRLQPDSDSKSEVTVTVVATIWSH